MAGRKGILYILMLVLKNGRAGEGLGLLWYGSKKEGDKKY
jgi:hypothetical protein